MQNQPPRPWTAREKTLYGLFGNPADYPTPQHYWTQAGKFVFIKTDKFDHIPFLRRNKGFWAHRVCVPSLEKIFKDIADAGLADLITSFDGCYNHRVIRGAISTLSMHAFGAAVDLNAKELPLGSNLKLDQRIVDIWGVNGWKYGGNFTGRKDPMHFEWDIKA